MSRIRNSKPAPLHESLENEILSTTVTSERTQIIVSLAGDGDYSTIGAAIACSAAGSEITMKAGIYYEALEITKPITLIGDPNGLSLIYNWQFAALKVTNTQVSLKNLGITFSGQRSCLIIENSRVEMTGCLIAHSGSIPLETSIQQLLANPHGQTEINSPLSPAGSLPLPIRPLHYLRSQRERTTEPWSSRKLS